MWPATVNLLWSQFVECLCDNTTCGVVSIQRKVDRLPQIDNLHEHDTQSTRSFSRVMAWDVYSVSICIFLPVLLIYMCAVSLPAHVQLTHTFLCMGNML